MSKRGHGLFCDLVCTDVVEVRSVLLVRIAVHKEVFRARVISLACEPNPDEFFSLYSGKFGCTLSRMNEGRE